MTGPEASGRGRVRRRRLSTRLQDGAKQLEVAVVEGCVAVAGVLGLRANADNNPPNVDQVTVDEFVERRVLPEYRAIVAELRRLMRQHAPSATEMISYGIPVYRQKRSLAVISPTKKGITFAFSRGAEFEDRYGLLEGVGKVSKNVRMKNLNEVNRPALRYYIKQALELDKR
jgi:hypothetical protein